MMSMTDAQSSLRSVSAAVAPASSRKQRVQKLAAPRDAIRSPQAYSGLAASSKLQLKGETASLASVVQSQSKNARRSGARKGVAVAMFERFTEKVGRLSDVSIVDFSTGTYGVGD